MPKFRLGKTDVSAEEFARAKGVDVNKLIARIQESGHSKGTIGAKSGKVTPDKDSVPMPKINLSHSNDGDAGGAVVPGDAGGWDTYGGG